MSGQITIQVQQLNRTPVFKISHQTWGVDFSSVFGATKLPGGALHWYYPAYYPVYKLVLDDLGALSRYHKTDLHISDAAQEHIEALRGYDEHIAKARLPKDFEFRTKPYKHQLDGLIHLVYSLRAGLFYSCGTGKSKCVIDWQRATGCWPLIICPRIAMHVWTSELKVHGIDQEYQPIDGATKEKKLQQIEQAGQYHGMIITYDTLRLYYEHVAANVDYNAIVADESQKIKQTRSQRTKVALEMSKKAYRRVIVSGTPSLGDPRDVYPQYRFLAPYFMPWNPVHFKRIFCVISPYNKHIVTGFKNLDILNRRINLVSIRRKKEDCLDLPLRTVQDISVPMETRQKKLYNKLARSSGAEGGADIEAMVNALVNTSMGGSRTRTGNTTINIPHAAALVNKLIQIGCGFVIKDEILEKDPCDDCAHMPVCVETDPPVRPWTPRCLRPVEDVYDEDDPELLVEEGIGEPPRRFAKRLDCAKATALSDLFDDLLGEPDHKVIVWGQYTEELNIIEDIINAAKLGYVRVDGSNTDKAKSLAAKFNDDAACRVYLGQVATGVSITLNSAQYMVYFSLPWNLEHYAQSLDRNHRLGQKSNVTVYRLLAPGVDAHIAKALSVKQRIADALIDDTGTKDRRVNRPITKVYEV
jgi:SNF2 family DNA or RNA helicase